VQRLRVRKTIGLVLLLPMLILSSLALLSPLQPAKAETLNPWTPTEGYPIGVYSYSCAASTDYIYCVGGYPIQYTTLHPYDIGSVYYAQISSSGIGAWAATTDYPTGIINEACVISGGFIYCIGGDAGCVCSATNAAYYGTVSSSGVGAWASTTSYPTPTADLLSCVASDGFIYCLGGGTDSVYFASISSTGIGAWTRTTSYPTSTSLQSCVTAGSYVYCVGGGPSSATATSAVYYSMLSSSGVGAWTSTTNYPTPIESQSCVVTGSYLYCIGGSAGYSPALGRDLVNDAVYYAPISSSGGVGTWITSSGFPTGGGLCFASGSYIYCASSSGAPDPNFFSLVGTALQTSQLMVNTVDTGGVAIGGLYTLLYQNGHAVAAGFSPATYTVDTGQTFTVQVDDYGSCHFDHWTDTGSTDAWRAVAVTGDTQVTAVYSCAGSSSASSVTIDSEDQNGSSIFGYHTVLSDSRGNALSSGFTSKTFGTTSGQTYSVQADNYGSCTFLYWTDGINFPNPRTFTATSAGLGFTAEYDCGTTSTINVVTIDSGGVPIQGYYTTLWQNGVQVDSCFSLARGCSFTVNNGQSYQVAVSDYGSESFRTWTDGTASRFHAVTVPSLSSIVSLVAIYT
jgi:hypothetical protein